MIEDSVILTHWVTRGKVQHPPLHVRNDELCWTRSSDEFTPIAEEHEGYMGNYGNTLDRQYRRSAVVVWPKNMHLRTLFRMDEATGMGELLSLARVDPEAAAQEAMTIFDTLLPDTPRLTSSESLRATLNLLLLLDDRSLSIRALAAFRIDAVKKAQMRPLIKLGVEHGKGFCEKLVAGWIDPPDKGYQHVSLDWIGQLPHFCEQLNELGNFAWKRVPERLWHFYFEKLTKKHERDSRSCAPSVRLAVSSSQVTQLVAMYRTAQCLPNKKAVTKLLQYIRKIGASTSTKHWWLFWRR